MKTILRRNFLILMLGITGVALIMPALHNMSAYAEDNDGGSDNSDQASNDSNDDNGSAGDDSDSAGDDDGGAKVTGATGGVFDPAKDSKSVKCIAGTVGCKAKK
jgi:hypothetical protein